DIRAFCNEDGLEGDEHPADLLAVGAATDPELGAWVSQAELGEECPGHRRVPGLSGIDEALVVPGAEGGLQGRRLDQLGSCLDDAQDPHWVGAAFASAGQAAGQRTSARATRRSEAGTPTPW